MAAPTPLTLERCGSWGRGSLGWGGAQDHLARRFCFVMLACRAGSRRRMQSPVSNFLTEFTF